jgi:hypothetical protein
LSQKVCPASSIFFLEKLFFKTKAIFQIKIFEKRNKNFYFQNLQKEKDIFFQLKI